MKDVTTMSITPEKDVVVLLGDKPFHLPLTHLTLETEVIEDTVGDDDLPFAHLAGPSTLRLYNGEQLLASTAYYDLNPDGRVIRLSELHTVLHQSCT